MTTPVFQPFQAWSVPRPDRLYRQMRHGRQRAWIDAQLVQNILAAYDLQLQGQVRVLGGPGRSRNVIMNTSRGKKMLKQYKKTIDPTAVIHEHSILSYLEQINFPAPRLNRTTANETFIQRNDACYAVFDVLEGYFQYHHYVWLPTQTRHYIAASARALALLHTALQEFTPDGQQPNGFRSRAGERWRDLSWFIDKLWWCRRELAQPPHDPLLAERVAAAADGIAATLHTLDATLNAAALPRLIIHGDYGPYNLFFKHGAPVVVLDWELARLDWRLTDLATALPSFVQTRLGFSFPKMQHFVQTYAACCPIDAEELQLLPSVWQFLTLRRVIVCWERYCRTHDAQWRVEAAHKLALAQWIAANQQPLVRWLTH